MLEFAANLVDFYIQTQQILIVWIPLRLRKTLLKNSYLEDFYSTGNI
jgi:hypothetical protein